MSGTMSAAARQDFLAEPWVGVLAVERPGRRAARGAGLVRLRAGRLSAGSAYAELPG